MHGDVPHAAPAVVATPLKFEPLAASYESDKRPSRLASRVPGMGMVSPVPVQTSAGVCPVAAAQMHSVKKCTARRAAGVPDEELRPPSQRSEGFGCSLRPVAAVSGAEAAAAADGVAASRQLAVTAPGCNRWRCVATDCAALQQMPLRATAGGAMQRAVHCCRLRCDATSSACPVGL